MNLQYRLKLDTSIVNYPAVRSRKLYTEDELSVCCRRERYYGCLRERKRRETRR